MVSRRQSSHASVPLSLTTATTSPFAGSFNRSSSRATTRSVSSLRLTPAPKQISFIHIGIDLGQQYTKACYQVWYPSLDPSEGPKSGALKTVVWENNECCVPSQLAVQNDGKMLCGHDVNRQLKRTHATESSLVVIRHLKSILLDPGSPLTEGFETEVLPLLSKDDITKVSRSLERYGESLDYLRMAKVTLYSIYMKYIYHEVLRFIAKTEGDLQWPVHPPNAKFYGSWSLLSELEIHAALALPIQPTAEQVQLIMSAAKAAGIPNCHPVAEPACALIDHLSTLEFQLLPGRTYLIIDAGAGSCDLKVFKALQTNPLVVQDIDLAPHVQTAWCGGSYVDEMAAQIFMDGVQDVGRVLERLSRYKSSIRDEQSLKIEVARQFEKEKRDFRGTEDLYLPLPGLPDIPEYRMVGGHTIVFSARDVREAFGVCLEGIFRMTDEAINAISKARGPGRQLDEIIVVGGAFHSPYLLEQYRNRYSTATNSLKHPVPVSLPSEAASVSITVARGAVRLSADKNIIGERHIRRSFCVRWWMEVGKAKYPPESIERSREDGRDRVCVTEFLLKKGLHRQVYESRPLRFKGAWRPLWEDELGNDGTWSVEEPLYYSDTIFQNKVWISDEIDLHDMPNSLTFKIALDDVRHLPKRLGRGRASFYYKVEYEVLLRLDRYEMTFELVMPRNGKWPEHGDRYADVIRKKGYYDATGVSELYSSA